MNEQHETDDLHQPLEDLIDSPEQTAPPAQSSVLSRVYLLALLGAALALAFTVILPFLNSLIFAGVLAIIAHPAHKRIQAKLGHRKNLAALASLLLVVVCIILPVLVFFSALVTQGVQVTSDIRAWITNGGIQELQHLQTHPFVLKISDFAQKHLGFIDLQSLDLQGQIMGLSKKTSEILISQSASIIGNISSFFVSFGIMLFVLFYLLRDGYELLAEIKYLSPLKDSQEDLIFTKIRGVTFSVLIGSLATALLQGLAGGIGMAVVGIPALFWGAMMAFASLVPVIGTALIWIPCVAYLLITGDYGWALFFFLWSVIVVASIDNLVRPLLMKGRGGMSTFTLFLAIIGGVKIFGISGLLYGPLVFGFALVMLSLYRVEYCRELDEGSCEGE